MRALTPFSLMHHPLLTPCVASRCVNLHAWSCKQWSLGARKEPSLETLSLRTFLPLSVLNPHAGLPGVRQLLRVDFRACMVYSGCSCT